MGGALCEGITGPLDARQPIVIRSKSEADADVAVHLVQMSGDLCKTCRVFSPLSSTQSKIIVAYLYPIEALLDFLHDKKRNAGRRTYLT